MTDIITLLPPSMDWLPEGWELLPKTLKGTDDAVVPSYLLQWKRAALVS